MKENNKNWCEHEYIYLCNGQDEITWSEEKHEYDNIKFVREDIVDQLLETNNTYNIIEITANAKATTEALLEEQKHEIVKYCLDTVFYYYGGSGSDYDAVFNELTEKYLKGGSNNG